MELIKKPVTGMKDILPDEMRLRDHVIALAKDTYGKYGFQSMHTPCVEHIENLSSNQGGENEKLIFKIMKRGEKLDIKNAGSANDLCDSGLRYDLTLPLSRYFANNQSKLLMPFKALQMGNVFRADRPQKGRFREFMQCDIDILGDATNLAEIELINATTTLLYRLGFKDFTVRINDRRILKAMANACDFDADRQDEIFIILDKLDKIGLEGVKEELVSAGFDSEKVNKYIDLFDGTDKGVQAIDSLAAKLGESLGQEVAENLKEIIKTTDAVKKAEYKIEFDPSLVRGMSYYTGTIFEIGMDEFKGSVAGGGRYDAMIGNFTGSAVPACGFSIGFERIITILMEKEYRIPDESRHTAFLVEKGMSAKRLSEIMKEADALRQKGETVLVAVMAKNRKFQKESLSIQGYSEFKDFYND